VSTTAGDQISAALRLIGQLAEGEVPSAATAQDGLNALNQMLDSWSTERLSIYATQDQIYTWPAFEAKRTIGPTGDFVGERPILLDDSTYFKDPTSGLSFGVKIVNQQQYNGIALKTAQSTYPQVIWANMTFPNAEMTVFPVPTKPLEWHIVSVQPLTQPAELGTQLMLPPGYLRAFKYNLAAEIAAEFGVEPTPQVQRIAMTSKRNLKRINNAKDIMSMPYALSMRNPRYNVFTNNF
jgi:hypothetical protein